MMIAFLILALINVWVLSTTQDPPHLVEVKERYARLRHHLRGHETFGRLAHPIPITAVHRMSGGVAYNTNKGAEICICLDGTPNQIFHVLLHELAHCTVPEYSHSEKFWKNYLRLRDIAVEIGVYDRIGGKQKFCGEHVSDD
jgi:hypothetical protein